MLSCISELESIVNKVSQQQDHLITLVEFTNDLCTTRKEEPTNKKIPDITFTKFSPYLESFDMDPPISYLRNPIREESEFSQILLFSLL